MLVESERLTLRGAIAKEITEPRDSEILVPPCCRVAVDLGASRALEVKDLSPQMLAESVTYAVVFLLDFFL